MNKLSTLAIVGFSLVAIALPASADTITQWTFENQPISGAPPYNNSPTPSSGTGTASVLGMNVYPTPNVGMNAADIVADPGSSDPNSQQAWRIRAQDGGNGPANGYSTLAPQYTQGAEFNVSTAGFAGIKASFDFMPTNRGVEDVELQYNVNAGDAGGWVNGGLFSNTVAGGVWNNGNVVDLSGISGVNNDPNFGIRLVTAYHPGTTTYLDTTGAPINNTSGNVRFDNVTVTGTPSVVPEPSSIALSLIGLGLAGLAARRRRAR